MSTGLIFALDRMGCLQTARWSDVSRLRRHRRPHIAYSDQSPVPEQPAEPRNDFGLEKIRVSTDSVVCSGESPPEDHPHVTLRIGRDGCVPCPYCGTRSRRGLAN